jgi:sugar lactone lactonase YvrE
MSSKKSSLPEVQILLTGLAMGESPRWHEGRLWFSDWGAQEIIAVDPDGNSEVIVRTSFGLPFCFDWLPDGRLLVVSGREGTLLRRQAYGALVSHADLRNLSGGPWNEIVVDGRGNAYVNGGPGIIAFVGPDRVARQVADGIAFPNGMAVTPDNSTLIIADSHGKKLTAFDIAADGSLSNRRVWADLGGGVPDGSASMPTTLSGTPMSPTSVACVSAKVVRCYRRSTLTAAASLACSEARIRARCSL